VGFSLCTIFSKASVAKS